MHPEEPRHSRARWVCQESEIRALTDAVDQSSQYALDTEFAAGSTYRPVLCLVQVAVARQVYLVDALSLKGPALAPLLSTKAEMVAHAAYADLELLLAHHHQRPTRLFDTQVAASFLGMSSPSLSNLSRKILGVEVDKSSRMTDWTKRPLPPHALTYAALDVADLSTIAGRQRDQLRTTPKKLAWCYEECEKLRTTPFIPTAPSDAWKRLRGASSMRAAQRLRAWALAEWRDDQAKNRNKTPTKVMSDDDLLALSKEPLDTRAKVLSHARVQKLHAQQQTSLADFLQEALACPPPAPLEMPTLDRSLEPLVGLLSACVSALGTAALIEPTVLATKADLSALVSNQSSRLDEGFRYHELRPLLEMVMAGELTLRVGAAGRSLELLDRRGRNLAARFAS